MDDDNAQWCRMVEDIVRPRQPPERHHLWAIAQPIELQGDRIVEVREPFSFWNAGKVTTNKKPANGSGRTLSCEHVHRSRFFDRELFMRLSPTSDETWQWAFAKIAGKTFRQLSKFNMPSSSGSARLCAVAYKQRQVHGHSQRHCMKSPNTLEALKKEAAQ